MKTKLYTIAAIALIFACESIHAQNTFPSTGAAGIGTTTPNASSLLEIKSTTKGMLMPRMTLAQRNAIVTPATGLLVYQTNSTPGFYYYNGSAWNAVTTKAGWSLTGNAGTTPGTNFLGTTDAHSLIFKVNNLRAGFIDYSTCCSGTRNTSFGQIALNSVTTGADNTATGYGSLYTDTTGSQNVAYGKYALFNNNASYNAAYGFNAMFSNTTGINNTATGSYALLNNTTGVNNTATGGHALYSNLTGTDNVANGYLALLNATSSYNTATGSSALYSTTTGDGNTANGCEALYSNISGSQNAANGLDAMYSNTYGSFNTATGAQALYNNISGDDNTAIGFQSLEFNTASANTAVGSGSLNSNTTGNGNTATGVFALGFNNGSGNTAVGYNSLAYNQSSSGNTAVGYNSLYNNGTDAVKSYDGISNTAIGSQSLYSNTIGYNNTGSGYQALYHNTTGYNNTAYGFGTLQANVSGIGNTALGVATDVNAGGLVNTTTIGYYALSTASNEVRIGSIGSIFGSDPTSIGGKVGWSTLSDGRVKKNIKENVPGLAFINKLKPITYNIDNDAISKIVQRPAIKDKDGKTIQPSSDEMAARKAEEQVVHTGFIAQDVEKAAKSLNYDFSGVDAAKNDKDLYGLRYAEFVVPLVKGEQELSKQNDSLKSIVSSLQSQINELKALMVSGNQSAVSGQQLTVVSSASLQQNIPNPFTNTTTIGYTLPSKFTNAQIIITDKSGKTLKTINLPAGKQGISGSGKGNLNVDASTLASGAYQYSLIVDGRLIDTKQMVLTK